MLFKTPASYCYAEGRAIEPEARNDHSSTWWTCLNNRWRTTIGEVIRKQFSDCRSCNSWGFPSVVGHDIWLSAVRSIEKRRNVETTRVLEIRLSDKKTSRTYWACNGQNVMVRQKDSGGRTPACNVWRTHHGSTNTRILQKPLSRGLAAAINQIRRKTKQRFDLKTRKLALKSVPFLPCAVRM